VTLFHAVVMSAAFLCSLVAGFLLAFASVVMPGLRSLDDDAFIRAFQAVDRVIQNNQPLFVVVWVGSVLAVVATAVMGIWQSGAERVLAVVAGLAYVIGVQLPTVAINIPLNNELQKLTPSAANESTRKRAREDFEARWNRWNVFRALWASLVSLLLIVLLLRL
jgi:uncharacterized membrane protein